MKDVTKILIILISLVAMLLISYVFSARLIFNRIAGKKDLHLHTRRILPHQSVDTIIFRVNEKISVAAQLMEKLENKSVNIFMADTYNLYLLFSFNADSFGKNTIVEDIFINSYDISKDSVSSRNSNHSKRQLSAVIAHEIIHTYLRRYCGVLNYFFLPKWKNEGYADYIAGGNSFPLDRGIELIENGQSENSDSFMYLKYSLVVKYILEVEKYSFDEFINDDKGFDFWLSRYRKWLNETVKL